MLTHAQIWSGIDALAARFDMSASALARLAGLDATSFNRSKRVSGETPPRPRWPTTESLAKVLAATGVDLADFAALASGEAPRRRGVPLIGFAQAGDHGFFDDAGFPVGEGWDVVEAPDGAEGAYALTIAGDSMAPVYREGDRIVVRPAAEPRRGDRVVVKTTGGEVMAKEVARVTADRLELRSLNPAYPGRMLRRSEIAWVARIVWASQ
ncbi:MAG: helix-turn-helix transcriptional regulator [Caulobacteraceae bacterium]|nr:helix-turn-helix transcriptional regulator [Caulobacter sp.]